MDQEERHTNNSCPTSTQQSRLSSLMEGAFQTVTFWISATVTHTALKLQPRYSMRSLDVTSCTTYANWKLSEENHFTICKQKLLNLLGKGFEIRKKMGTKASEALSWLVIMVALIGASAYWASKRKASKSIATSEVWNNTRTSICGSRPVENCTTDTSCYPIQQRSFSPLWGKSGSHHIRYNNQQCSAWFAEYVQKPVVLR